MKQYISYLYHLLVSNNLTKTFRLIERTKDCLVLEYRTNVSDGLSKIYIWTFYIRRTSEHCYRIAYFKTFTNCRHLPPLVVIDLRFGTATEVLSFFFDCRAEIGADNNGRVIHPIKL